MKKKSNHAIICVSIESKGLFMNIKDNMDGSFYHDGKLIYYLVPVDKGNVFGSFEKEKTYRNFHYFYENGTAIRTYKAYDDFVKLQNITPLIAKEYYIRMLEENSMEV